MHALYTLYMQNIQANVENVHLWRHSDHTAEDLFFYTVIGLMYGVSSLALCG